MRVKHWFLSAVLVFFFVTFSHASVVVDSSYFYWTGVTGPTGTLASPTVPDNLALAAGSTGFAIDVIAGGAYTQHQIDHLNDGTYGNSNSWIGQTGRNIDIYNNGSTIVNTGFGGVAFASQTPVYNFSIGRDNLSNDQPSTGGSYLDRVDGTYYVQTTTASSPNASTADSAWTTIGSITISGGDSHRHQFNLNAPVSATGIRVVVPKAETSPPLWTGTGVDEIEVNTSFAAKVNHGAPVAYWRLGDAAGATVAVNSGTGGTAINGVYNPTSPGKVDHAGLIGNDTDTAAHFASALAQHVTGTGLSTAVPGTPTATNVFANDWTIEGWFIRDAATPVAAIFSNNIGGDKAPILTFGDGGSFAPTSKLCLMQAGQTWEGNIGIDLSTYGSSPTDYLGKRIFAVLTKKTSPDGIIFDKASMYVNVNGTWLTPVIDQPIGWLLTPHDGFAIGSHFEHDYFFDGTIDDVALYNRALSQTEVLDQYSSAVPEPGTLVLLAVGLVSILAYAWRKGR